MNSYNPAEYFDYATISAVKLVSSQNYQRSISKKQVEKISKEFDPFKVNPIKVAFRDGKYYVFDGQHTLAVIIHLFGINTIVPVMIFKHVSHEIEALLFATQDDNKKKISTSDKLRALYISGDETVTLFKKICEDNGFICDFYSGGTKDHRVVSYSYLYDKVYTLHGKERLAQVLRIVGDAWGRSAECTYSHVLKGVNCFIDYYDGEFLESTLVGALRDTSASEIRNLGNADTTRKRDERYAAQIVAKYNARCRGSAKKMKVLF